MQKFLVTMVSAGWMELWGRKPGGVQLREENRERYIRNREQRRFFPGILFQRVAEKWDGSVSGYQVKRVLYCFIFTQEKKRVLLHCALWIICYRRRKTMKWERELALSITLCIYATHILQKFWATDCAIYHWKPMTKKYSLLFWSLIVLWSGGTEVFWHYVKINSLRYSLKTFCDQWYVSWS